MLSYTPASVGVFFADIQSAAYGINSNHLGTQNVRRE